MTIQFLAQWNGYEEDSIQSLSAAEEARLVSAGLARFYSQGMDGRAGEAVYVPHTQDTSGILVAAYAAKMAGGGVVKLPGVAITLSASLPLYSGVTYRGVMPAVTYPINPPDSQFTYSGGTRLIGNGTFAAFSANDTDRGSPNAIFGSDAISNAYVENMVISGFTRGISAGAVNAMGLMHGGLQNLFIEDCTEWGVFAANFMHCDIQRIWTQNCRNGQYYGALVDASVLMPGNSKMHTLFDIVPSPGTICPDPRLHRGLVFEAGGVAAKLNEIDAQRLQCNAFSKSQLSVTATLNATTSIVVPDGTKFAVGMPVVFTTTANGFTANLQYFVLSVVSNTLTLGSSRTGSAITASGSGSMTLTTRGFPNLELASRNTGAGVSNGLFTIDAEGTAGSAVYLENATGLRVLLTETPSAANCDSTIVGRNSGYCEYISRNTVTTDLDGNSAVSYAATGLPVSAVRTAPPIGILYDPTLTRNVISLSRNGQVAGTNWSFQNRSPGNADWTYPGLPLGQAAYSSASTSQNINAGQKAGVAVYTGTGAGAWTWNQNGGTDMVGYMLTVKNCGTGVLTFTLGGSGNGTFDGMATKTVLTLNAPSSPTPGGVAVLYCYANGSWAVLSITNGAIS